MNEKGILLSLVNYKQGQQKIVGSVLEDIDENRS
jgi:hypothetical protein